MTRYYGGASSERRFLEDIRGTPYLSSTVSPQELLTSPEAPSEKSGGADRRVRVAGVDPGRIDRSGRFWIRSKRDRVRASWVVSRSSLDQSRSQ